MKIRILHSREFLLGEGLFWDCKANLLWGVDIERQLAWNFSPELEEMFQFDVGEKVGWCYPNADGNSLLVGKKSGIVILSRKSQLRIVTKISIPGLGDDLRLNEAKPDLRGGILGGVMEDLPELSMPRGFLYGVNQNGVVKILDDGYYIPNGPVISPCGTVLLHTDSYLRVIYAFDFDASTSAVKNKKIWKKFSVEEGCPDGMCFDSIGNLWVAFWGSGTVRKFDLEGNLLEEVKFPCAQISNVCFGGDGLTRLFVTTAVVGLTLNERIAQPFAGKVFEIIGHEVVGFPVKTPDIYVAA